MHIEARAAHAEHPGKMMSLRCEDRTCAKHGAMAAGMIGDLIVPSVAMFPGRRMDM